MTPELERWLTERLEHERQVTLDIVVAGVKDIIQREGEAHRQAFEERLAKLAGFLELLQSLAERMAHLNRDTRDESDNAKMN